MQKLSRRQWLGTAAGLAFSAGLNPSNHNAVAERVDDAVTSPAPEIAIFTKSFQVWPLEKVCEKFAELGVTGLDLTVRPGGHVLPEQVVQKLPEAQRIAHKHGLKIVQITSNINTPDKEAESLFDVAGELGIRQIKLGYYRTPGFGNLAEQIQETKKQLAALIKLAQPRGVVPCVHVHSGSFLPSHGTMLYLLLKDFSTEEIGAYVDTLHMSLEGGSAGWKHGLDLLAPWIRLCAVKNYLLTEKKRDEQGQQRWGWKTAPLADGISPLPDFVKTLKQIHYSGPYSLHSEYLPELTVDACFDQTAADLQYFRKLLQA